MLGIKSWITCKLIAEWHEDLLIDDDVDQTPPNRWIGWALCIIDSSGMRLVKNIL